MHFAYGILKPLVEGGAIMRTCAKLLLVGLLLACGALLPGCASEARTPIAPIEQTFSLDAVPAFSGSPYVEIDGNEPSFSEAERELAAFEAYAPLDELGRCGTALAVVGPETMPTEERGSIGSVRPSGWHLVKYDIVDGAYLYNRCHLIAYRLAGENAYERNLITGTRFMNAQGMVPFEKQVADYASRTGNRVLYRATPVFEGADLVARGVHLEAESMEDDGAGVRFNVFVYNVQPGIEIDYATGESWLDGASASSDGFDASRYAYILNTNTRRIHRPDCPSVEDMKAANREGFDGTREEAEARGFVPCGRCNP